MKNENKSFIYSFIQNKGTQTSVHHFYSKKKEDRVEAGWVNGAEGGGGGVGAVRNYKKVHAMAVFNITLLNNVCVLKLYSKNIHFILQGIKGLYGS